MLSREMENPEYIFTILSADCINHIEDLSYEDPSSIIIYNYVCG